MSGAAGTASPSNRGATGPGGHAATGAPVPLRRRIGSSLRRRSGRLGSALLVAALIVPVLLIAVLGNR